MTDFADRFAELSEFLDDPNGRFHGEQMVEDLLALEALVPDRASEALLFRELAVLQGKRGHLDCLDYADRALAADAEAKTIPEPRLYLMHMICGDVGTSWRGGPRTATHLQRALELHPVSGRSLEEAFALRLNRAVHERTEGTARMGLDWFEPLLDDAERFYGADSKELGRLIGMMSESEELLGNMDQALVYGERSLALVDDRADKGRRVSALVTFAGLNMRCGKAKQAYALMEEAVTFAEAECTPATARFAKNQMTELFPEGAPTSLLGRLRGWLGRPQN